MNGRIGADDDRQTAFQILNQKKSSKNVKGSDDLELEPEILSWDEGLTRIERVRPDLVDLLRGLALVEKDLASTRFLRARYPYRRAIVRTGRSMLPDGRELDTFQDSMFAQANGLGLGFIVGRTASVVEDYFEAQRRTSRTAAILRGGDHLGLFELLDRRCGPAFEFTRPWNIYSGAYHIGTLAGTNTVTFCNDINSRLGTRVDKLAYKEKSNVVERFQLFREFEDINTWYTDVIYVPRSLIEMIFHTYDNPGNSVNTHLIVNRIVLLLYQNAWDAMWHLRDITRDYAHLFFLHSDSRSASLSHRVDSAAFFFWRSLVNCLLDKTPVFRLALEGDDYAPVSAIVSFVELIKGARLPVIVPEVFSRSGDFSYIPLEYLAMADVSNVFNSLYRLKDIFNRNILVDKNFNWDIESIFDGMIFRIGGANKNESLYRKMSIKGSKEIDTSEEMFFGVYANNKVVYNKGENLLKPAVRLIRDRIALHVAAYVH